MKYNFDEVIDRSNNRSSKYDERLKKFGTEDVIPLWVADMDFKTAQPIIDACRKKLPSRLIDSFVLGNPHDDVIPAICGATDVSEVEALGVFETYSAASAVVAADNTVKTSMVKLIEIRLARGMCGKSYVLITGDVAAVTAAIERAKRDCGDTGMFLDSAVIPRPAKDLWKNIL